MGSIAGFDGLAPASVGLIDGQAVGPLSVTGGGPPPPSGDEGVLFIKPSDQNVIGGTGAQALTGLGVDLDALGTPPYVAAFEYTIFFTTNATSTFQYAFSALGSVIANFRASNWIIDPGAADFIDVNGQAYRDGLGTVHPLIGFTSGGFDLMTFRILGYCDVTSASAVNDLVCSWTVAAGTLTVREGSWSRWQVES